MQKRLQELQARSLKEEGELREAVSSALRERNESMKLAEVREERAGGVGGSAEQSRARRVSRAGEESREGSRERRRRREMRGREEEGDGRRGGGRGREI